MRKFYLYILAISLLFGVSSCEKNSNQNLYSVVTISINLPDESKFVSMTVDMSLAGNFFRNYNNGLEYDIPTFTNNSATIMVQKGVYYFSFDGTAKFSDGSTKKIRCADYNSPNQAIAILDDNVTIQTSGLFLQ